MAKDKETAIREWNEIPPGILPPGKTYVIFKEGDRVVYSFDAQPKQKDKRHGTRQPSRGRAADPRGEE